MRLTFSLLLALGTFYWMFRVTHGPRLTDDRARHDQDRVTDATRRRYQ